MFKILSKKAYNAILEERDAAIRIEAKTFDDLSARKNEIEILNDVIAKRDNRIIELNVMCDVKDERIAQLERSGIEDVQKQLEATKQELAEQHDINRGLSSTIGELKRDNETLRKRIVKLQKESKKNVEKPQPK